MSSVSLLERDNFSCRLLPQPTEHREDEGADLTRLDLEMHYVAYDAFCPGAKPLTYRKSLGKVKWKWLCFAGRRPLRKDQVQKFLQVSTASVVYDTWHHTAGHSRETGALFLWHADDSVLVDIWTPRLYLLHNQTTLVHLLSCPLSQLGVEPAAQRARTASVSFLTHTIFVWITSSSQIKPAYAFASEENLSSDIHSYHTRSSKDFHIDGLPTINALWNADNRNNLPTSLKSISMLALFKKQLAKSFFRKHVSHFWISVNLCLLFCM